MDSKRFVDIAIIVGVIILIGATGYFVVNRRILSELARTISSFDECAKAGYPIGESYPRQCWTPDGRRFVETGPVINIPVSGSITIIGKITCLPKKETGPQTEECAIGLQGTDGLYYGLENLYRHDPTYKFSVIGLDVKISGTFRIDEMPGPGGPEFAKYDVVGVIDVASIREN